jgi:hypothetical protein
MPKPERDARWGADCYSVLQARENANRGRPITPKQFEATLRVIHELYALQGGTA